MALVVHSNIAAMVAHQNLESHAARSDDAAAAASASARTATVPTDGEDSVHISYASSVTARPVTITGVDQAAITANLLATQITTNPALSLQAQANSDADRVFALVK